MQDFFSAVHSLLALFPTTAFISVARDVSNTPLCAQNLEKAK